MDQGTKSYTRVSCKKPGPQTLFLEKGSYPLPSFSLRAMNRVELSHMELLSQIERLGGSPYLTIWSNLIFIRKMSIIAIIYLFSFLGSVIGTVLELAMSSGWS